MSQISYIKICTQEISYTISDQERNSFQLYTIKNNKVITIK